MTSRQPDRRIYVDIDDVLCQTAASLIELLERHHARRIEYEELRYFDLGRCFELDEDQLAEFMDEVHRPEVIEGIAPIEGAASALQAWTEQEYEVVLLTGRPPATEPATRRWLERCEISYASLGFVDKYGRGAGWDPAVPALSLEAVAEMRFCHAVEDSLEMAVFLAERVATEVALIDHPWNREVEHVAPETLERIVRCRSWDEVMERFPAE